MTSGAWLLPWVVALALICSIASAAPATAPLSAQANPGWIPSPLVNLPPNAESVTIPLRRAGNLLCAAVQIDGKQAGWFVIDTGSSNTIIDASAAKRLGFENESGLDLSTMINSISSNLVRYENFQIGQVTMRRGVAAVADMTAFSSHANFPFAGVLGCDLLRELPVAIDFRSATLTLYSREHFQPPVSPSFPLTFHADVPSVQASIEGNDAPILIDTGTGSAFSLKQVFIDLYQISVVRRHSEFNVVAGAGDVATVVESSFGPVKILGKEFQNIRANCLLQRGEGVSTDAGSIGAPLLQDACLTLDYKMKKAWMDWRQQAQSKDEMVRALGDPKSEDLAGVTPLMRAAELGRVDVVTELLKPGADVNAKSKGDLTALFYAASYHHPRVVKLLLSAGADPNITSAWGNLSPLYLAAGNGDAESVRALLAAHAKVDLANTSGETALIVAAGADYPEVVHVLLEAGADVSAMTKDDRTALATAAALASPQVLGLLLQKGAKVDGSPGLPGANLIAAASNNNLENVDFLLKHGADVNQPNPRGITPLMMAAMHGHESVVLKLLEFRADPSLRSLEGKTAADYTRSVYVRSALLTAADARASKSNR